uniref:Bestrophin homolog n=1 Tax=Strongyloides venezuelensis TaxID=75913 RepID=A0A0K0EVI8_STRVS
MTVSYMHNIGNAGFRNIFKVLLRWRGSVWKSVMSELIIWSTIYAILSVIYRVILSPDQKKTFESVTLLCREYGDFIPLTFMLGNFVTTIITRWTKTFNSIPWSDDFSLYIAAYLEGSDERSILMRRGIVRYMIALQIMILRLVSPRVKKKFPTFDEFVGIGVLTVEEREQMTNDMCFHLPVRWAFQVVMTAKKEGKIRSEQAVQDLYRVLNEFRAKCIQIFLVDFIPIPLCYTQVVLLTVRIYFTVAIIGRQFHTNDSDRSPTSIDLYVPFLTMFQFIFYVGWAKVAEALLNPFGSDDDDFEVNWIWERNFKVGLSTVESNIDHKLSLYRDNLCKDDEFDLGELLVTHSGDFGGSEPLVGSAVLDAIGGEEKIGVLSRRRSLYPDSYYDGQSDKASILPPSRQTIRQRLASIVSNITSASTKELAIINIKEKGQKLKNDALGLRKEHGNPSASYSKMEDDYEGKCIINPLHSSKLNNYSSQRNIDMRMMNEEMILEEESSLNDNDSVITEIVKIEGGVRGKVSKNNDIIIDISPSNDSDSYVMSKESISQQNSNNTPSIDSSSSNVPNSSLIISQRRNKTTNKPYIVLSLPKSIKKNDKKNYKSLRKMKSNKSGTSSYGDKKLSNENTNGLYNEEKNIRNIQIGSSIVEEEYDSVNHIKF